MAKKSIIRKKKFMSGLPIIIMFFLLSKFFDEEDREYIADDVHARLNANEDHDYHHELKFTLLFIMWFVVSRLQDRIPAAIVVLLKYLWLGTETAFPDMNRYTMRDAFSWFFTSYIMVVGLEEGPRKLFIADIRALDSSKDVTYEELGGLLFDTCSIVATQTSTRWDDRIVKIARLIWHPPTKDSDWKIKDLQTVTKAKD